MRELLRLEHLAVSFPLKGRTIDRLMGRPREVVRAVDGVDLGISRGEILALVGESGSGKTTVGRAIVKLQQPSSGNIWLDGEDVTTIQRSADLRAYRRRVQMIFQDPYQALNPRQSVFEATAEPVLGLKLTRSRPERRQLVSQALEEAGLHPATDFFGRFPHELSGGQRQRVVIAGALVAQPELIVADEPVSMLDASIRAQILEIFVKLRAERNVAFLFITHDLALAWLIADRIAVMYLGKVVEVGDAQGVMDTPRHPYTIALLDSIPKIHRGPQEREIRPLAGEAPNAAHIPSGCRFHPRCPLAFDRCRDEEPPLLEVAPDHVSACWLATELGRRTKESALAPASSQPRQRRAIPT